MLCLPMRLLYSNDHRLPGRIGLFVTFIYEQMNVCVMYTRRCIYPHSVHPLDYGRAHVYMRQTYSHMNI